jgi:peptide/nickel transport system permease protein
MISAARATMAQAPLLLLWPCLALSLTILAMNALCDALRDAVDPVRTPRRRRRVIDLLAPGLRPEAGAVLEVRGLTIEIATPAGVIRPVRDVSLRVAAGELLAIVGESGSGKSLTGLAVMGLLPGAARVAEGGAWLEGEELLRMAEPRLRGLRGNRMAMVFQDPLSGLNPVHRVGAQIVEAIRAHRGASDAAGDAEKLLHGVGMPDPARRMRAFPHEMSGGMRQRVMLAMGIANDPVLLIADEPTTALDVTIQAQVLRLIGGLRERGMGVVFVTHSLPVVAEIADRVAVMYAGEVVEEGATDSVFSAPLHPYTAALLASAPGEDGALPAAIPGVVPPPYDLPPGCVFAPRCSHRLAECEVGTPALVAAGAGRATRCIRWRDLAA